MSTCIYKHMYMHSLIAPIALILIVVDASGDISTPTPPFSYLTAVGDIVSMEKKSTTSVNVGKVAVTEDISPPTPPADVMSVKYFNEYDYECFDKYTVPVFTELSDDLSTEEIEFNKIIDFDLDVDASLDEFNDVSLIHHNCHESALNSTNANATNMSSSNMIDRNDSSDSSDDDNDDD